MCCAAAMPQQNKIDYYIRADMRTVWNANRLHAKYCKGGSQMNAMSITISIYDRLIYFPYGETHTHTHISLELQRFQSLKYIYTEKTPFGLVLVLFCLKKRLTKQKIHASQLGLGQVEIKRHKLTEKIISAHCMY